MESNNPFKDQKILLGVTGSIAAYKAAEICARLIKLGAAVYPAMTCHAACFLNPITLSTLSSNKTITDLFAESEKIYHVSLSQSIDLMLIAPASANIISKSACGICDDFLSTAVLSTDKPVLFAPAMNEAMYRNPVLQENIQKLKRRGNFFFAGPGEGYLACGKKGKGRMEDIEIILEHAAGLLSYSQDLQGKNVLITAGGTKEPIDAVRYISNYSSGKMGCALAAEAYFRGARKVTLISANRDIIAPYGVETLFAPSTSEMKSVLQRFFSDAHIMIMAAAVSDIVAQKTYPGKLKKEDGLIDALIFKENENILSSLAAAKKKGQFLVGFAAESRAEIASAQKKLMDRDVDMIVCNDILRKDIAMDSEYNEVSILGKDGSVTPIAKNTKRIIARAIFDNIIKIIKRSDQ